ncbi:MAG: hypothetical protein KQI62_13385 [Deltaproteobacteria bacterium]|nr:hypothetical protein [Deltaproteobacteria bacterium]
MERCIKCGIVLQDDEVSLLEGAMCCDDCYLKAVSPKVMPQHRNDPAEFLRRLKYSHPAKHQKFD